MWCFGSNTISLLHSGCCGLVEKFIHGIYVSLRRCGTTLTVKTRLKVVKGISSLSFFHCQPKERAFVQTGKKPPHQQSCQPFFEVEEGGGRIRSITLIGLNHKVSIGQGQGYMVLARWVKENTVFIIEEMLREIWLTQTDSICIIHNSKWSVNPFPLCCEIGDN